MATMRESWQTDVQQVEELAVIAGQELLAPAVIACLESMSTF